MAASLGCCLQGATQADTVEPQERFVNPPGETAMTRTASVAVLLVLLTGSLRAEEKGALPLGPQPKHAVASIDGDGFLTVRFVSFELRSKSIAVPEAKKPEEKKPSDEPETKGPPLQREAPVRHEVKVRVPVVREEVQRLFPLDVEVYDAGGEMIDR